MANKQSGVIAPIWLYLAGAIILALVMTGLVTAWNSYTKGLDKRGYDRGVAETDAKYTKRDNAQLVRVIAEKDAALKRAEAAETKAANSQAIASTNYQKGVKDGKVQTDKLVAGARAGSLQLRDPGQVAGSTSCGQRNAETPPPDAKPGSDGQAGSNLSVSAAEFLLSLTGEADTVTKQLELAQTEIRTILEVCAKR